MKIGLLTYQYSFNNGAILQAYATQKVLSELGHDVEFINVYKERRSLLNKTIYGLKNIRTNWFYKNYYPSVTRFFNDIHELRNASFDYDCLMVGSDQVWNPDICKDKCMAFFLDFGESNIKRVSYASSFGISNWPKRYECLVPEIRNSLALFEFVSVREKTGKALLENKFGIKGARIVVDPTILCGNYEEITGKINENGEVICYLLGRLPFQLEIARKRAIELECKPMMISNLLPMKGFRYTYPPSVPKWIRLIGGAKTVITDSFHGVVFSLLYNRDFIVVPQNNGRSSRMIDLLKTVGLENRIFKSVEEYSTRGKSLNPIDYEFVNKKIASARNNSMDFLKNALR